MIRHLLTLGMIATCVGASAGTAWGQTYTWTGNTSNRWNNNSSQVNWTLNSTPSAWTSAATNTAIFSGANQGTIDVRQTITLGTISVRSNGYDFVTTNSGGSFVLSGNAVINVRQNYSSTLGVAVSGSNGLNKTGAGTLVLTGDNSYSGGTRIANGTLDIATSGALPSGSNITLDGGVFATNATLAAGTLTLNNDSQIALGSSGSITFNGLSFGSGDLLITGWTGPAYGAGTAGRIYFTGIGSIPNTTFSSFLNNVQFENYGPGGYFRTVDTNTYELVAAPEPTTVLALGALGLAAFGRLRRRKGVADAAPEPNVALAV